MTTKKYKIGLIYCLLNRAWKICSYPSEREREIDKLLAILAKNEYSEQVVESDIQKFIKNRQPSLATGTKDQHAEEQPQPQPQEPQAPPAQTRYMVLPYVSNRVEGFTKRLKAHVIKFYPQVDFVQGTKRNW